MFMFRGIGSAEQRILAFLSLEPHAGVSDMTELFPRMHPKTVRRAMRSLARKGAVRLDDSIPMAVSRLDAAPVPAPPYRVASEGNAPIRERKKPPYGVVEHKAPPARKLAFGRFEPSRNGVAMPEQPAAAVQSYSEPHPEIAKHAAKQAAQLRRGRSVNPVVIPSHRPGVADAPSGSAVEIIPASASGGFDRPKTIEP